MMMNTLKNAFVLALSFFLFSCGGGKSDNNTSTAAMTRGDLEVLLTYDLTEVQEWMREHGGEAELAFNIRVREDAGNHLWAHFVLWYFNQEEILATTGIFEDVNLAYNLPVGDYTAMVEAPPIIWKKGEEEKLFFFGVDPGSRPAISFLEIRPGQTEYYKFGMKACEGKAWAGGLK